MILSDSDVIDKHLREFRRTLINYDSFIDGKTHFYEGLDAPIYDLASSIGKKQLAFKIGKLNGSIAGYEILFKEFVAPTLGRQERDAYFRSLNYLKEWSERQKSWLDQP